MNQPLTPQQPNRSLAQLISALGPQSSLATQAAIDPRALAAGIKPSFAVVTFKGKTWGIRHRGTTTQLLARDQNGQVIGAIPTVDLVIIKAATAISKSYYIEKYKEGDFNQPDCWSTNGQTPDPAAPKLQSVTCRGCRWDAFGSRTMDDGRKGKACQDGKRLAVVPAGDLKNEAYGGPMLLRLPPSTFAGLSELESQLHMQGYHYFAVVMRLSFDHQAAFPKIQFTPVRVLNDHEMQEVLALQSHDQVERILSEEVYEVAADPQQATAEAKPVQVQPTPPVKPTPPAAQPGTTAFTTAAPPPMETVRQMSMPPAQPDAMTPEQAKIAQLEAELAAARTADAKPKRGRRSNPVTPNGPQPQVTTQQADETVSQQDQSDEDTPPDLDSRIDALLKDTPQ